MRDTQGSAVFAISSACYRRRRIADSWWTLRVRIFYALENSGTATKLMSSWQCFTNARPAIQNRLGRSYGKSSMNFGAQFKWAKVDHRMERLERKSKKPLLDG